MLMMTTLIAILCALLALIVLVFLLRFDQQRQHEERLTAFLVTAIPPLIPTNDPRAILGWANSFDTIRRLFPVVIKRIEQVSGRSFPISDDFIEAAHARCTAEWLAWERKHNAEYQEKTALLDADIGATDRMADPEIRARSARLEDEKLQSYQQRYEEYVSIGKALAELQQK